VHEGLTDLHSAYTNTTHKHQKGKQLRSVYFQKSSHSEQMSYSETRNKKQRVKKGQSDGAYLEQLGAAGPTNKLQAKWHQQPPPKRQPER
jgi:hypothetical protein